METVSTAKLEYNVTIFSESKEIDSSAETTLPEYLPDIHRVVRVDARPTTTGTTSEEGMAVVEGWVDCVIMYLPREGSLQSHFCRVPYSLKESDTRITAKTRLSATVTMSSVTCKPQSERKLMVSCKVRAILQAEESRGAEVLKPSEADRMNAEFLETGIGAAKFVGRTVKEFTIEEMLELPGGSPHIERMLRCDVSLATSEYKVVTNRVVIKGEAYVICLYLSDVESDRVEQYTTTIPFNEVVDVEGAREGDMAAISYSILDIVYGVMADASGEDRRLSLRIDAAATVAVYTRVNFPIIRDTYSTSRAVKTVSSALNTEVFQEYNCSAKVADTVSLGAKTSDIFAVEAYADVKGTAVEGGMPIFKGDLQVSFLTKDEEGGLQAIDRCIKFASKCAPLEAETDKGIIFSGSCTIDDFDWRVSVSGEISITAAISCCGIGRIKMPVTTVSGMELGEKTEVKKSAAAITLYYPTGGETLWDVGKRYLVARDAICAANQIENGEIAAFFALNHSKMIADAASAFVVIMLAELADKTQFLAMGLTARYKLGEVATGIALAIMTLNLLGVGVGRFVAEVLPGELIRLVAGLSFLAFAIVASSPQNEDAGEKRQAKLGGIPAIYAAFILAELGDKTQLGVLSLTAANPHAALGIFLGATAGMLVADGAAVTLGVMLGKALPQKLMCRLSALVFTVFGAVMLYPALQYYLFDMAEVAALCIGIFFITALLLRTKGNDGGCHG